MTSPCNGTHSAGIWMVLSGDGETGRVELAFGQVAPTDPALNEFTLQYDEEADRGTPDGPWIGQYEVSQW